MDEITIPENTVAALVRDVIGGNKERFIRLGVVTVAQAFGGNIAGAVANGLMDRVWKKASCSKDEHTVLDDTNLSETVGNVVRTELRTEMTDIVTRLDDMKSIQQDTNEILTTVNDSVRQSNDEIALIRKRIDSLTLIPASPSSPTIPNATIISLLDRHLRVAHFSRGVVLFFTIHNFNNTVAKIRNITLRLNTRELCDEVVLPRAGQKHENFALNINVEGCENGIFELLDGIDTQFTLPPGQAEGFSLNINCDDGYLYRFEIEPSLIDIVTYDEFPSEPTTFDVLSPITTPATLKARRHQSKVAQV